MADPRLRELQHGGSTVREDTPERHQKTKAGTPTMGGHRILVAILVATLLWANLRNRYVWVLVLATAGLGLIGLMDDWKKLKTRKGISAREKFGGPDRAGGRADGLALRLAARRLHHRAS